MTSDLSSLYKNKPAILWVEDPLTRTWLHQVWRDTDVALYVAGGNESVEAVVHESREQGHSNVFGLRDRDFGETNQARWLDPVKGTTVFVPGCFEVENFLLDFDGMARLGPSHNRLGRPSSELASRARDSAEGSRFWMAARATVAEVRRLVTADFPRHPKLGNPARMTDRPTAIREIEALLLESEWSRRLRPWARDLDLAWLTACLDEHLKRLDHDLADGSWLRTWSGKEILAVVAGHMQCRVDDIAKALAAAQRESHTVDPSLFELRTAIRRRAGIESW